MPAQRQSRRRPPPTNPSPTLSATRRATPEPVGRNVFVLGAGVDVPYGLPLVSGLMPALADFAKGEGKAIDKLLRKKLPHLPFTFDRFAGKQSDAFLQQLFGGAVDVVPSLTSAVAKLKADSALAPIGIAIESLCQMASMNLLTGPNVAALAQIAGEAGQVGDAELLLDPSKITLEHMPATALHRAFSRALSERQRFTEAEQEVMQLFVDATSNFEELLSNYFTLYCTKRTPDQKTFLYLAWLLWSYLRLRSTSRQVLPDSLYPKLPVLATNVITFNYTQFFDQHTLKRVLFFHGRLDRYLRVDDRAVVTDNQLLKAAVGVDRVLPFIDSLRLDVTADPAIDIPSIVPPISFKPVMSREQLRTWADADRVLSEASTVVIVGYSFNATDEHFNDLLRKANPTARVLVVNPDDDRPLKSICQILNVPYAELVTEDRRGLSIRSARRLTFVKAEGEAIDEQFLERVRT